VRDSRTTAGKRRVQKPSPTESPLLFEVDPESLEPLTALGRIPPVAQAFRILGLACGMQQERGGGRLVGHEMPSPEVARKFSNVFRKEEKIQKAQQRRTK
jgi:hypothetical protein